MADRPIRVGQVAELLGLGRDGVKQIPPSELPWFRANARGDRRYQKADVLAYIERRMAVPESALDAAWETLRQELIADCGHYIDNAAFVRNRRIIESLLGRTIHD